MTIQTDASPYINSIPSRLPDSNKGTYGKVLVLAGCKGMSGAAYLSALAAYRTGAGLVKFLTHEENRTILQTLLPEAVYEGYDEKTSLKDIALKNISWADVVIAGPGLGTSKLSEEILAETLTAIKDSWLDDETIRKKSPILILDADGLNILSRIPSIKEDLSEISEKVPVIVTPHPMEMSRLSGKTVQEILDAPDMAASEFSGNHHLITIMKGSETIISDRTGEQLFKNTLKSPALSKGGSGDVLSGAIAGIYTLLRADTKKQDKLPGSKNNNDLSYDASVLSVIIHAKAGQYAAKQYGINGVLARDTANSLGFVIDQMLS
ncbi:NAD(P)H-hydrate dehydratase [Oribacterium sp. C9]|uniref:NAD(P)H-hydrate dehydratase n=1 Tax=Oribacterium sp. C9 TaxID=1943579 RepID=UPI00098ECD98|nr:NAD(P)H-hydrate dehydratase [Oribacterium sp. C9]OON87199.1 NAD(P)H-hydrate dehydratase [Oribacterium sp. C9]